MPRGVVLWLDPTTGRRVRSISSRLEGVGLAGVSVDENRPDRPHVSLIVADALDLDGTLAAIGPTPLAPVEILIEAVGLVVGGHLLLTITPSVSLLDEQSRVHRAVQQFATNSWPHYEPDRWLPHLTMARGLLPDQLATAIEIVAAELPIDGELLSGGIEDGDTGECWESMR